VLKPRVGAQPAGRDTGAVPGPHPPEAGRLVPQNPGHGLLQSGGGEGRGGILWGWKLTAWAWWGGAGMGACGRGRGEGSEESLLRVPNVFEVGVGVRARVPALVLEEFKAQLKRSHEESPPALGPMLSSAPPPSRWGRCAGGYRARGAGAGVGAGLRMGARTWGKLRLLSLSRVDDFLGGAVCV